MLSPSHTGQREGACYTPPYGLRASGDGLRRTYHSVCVWNPEPWRVAASGPTVESQRRGSTPRSGLLHRQVEALAACAPASRHARRLPTSDHRADGLGQSRSHQAGDRTSSSHGARMTRQPPFRIMRRRAPRRIAGDEAKDRRARPRGERLGAARHDQGQRRGVRLNRRQGGSGVSRKLKDRQVAASKILEKTIKIQATSVECARRGARTAKDRPWHCVCSARRRRRCRHGACV